MQETNLLLTTLLAFATLAWAQPNGDRLTRAMSLCPNQAYVLDRSPTAASNVTLDLNGYTLACLYRPLIETHSP